MEGTPVESREARRVLERQDGAIARRQLLKLGWSQNDLRRALRRRDLVPLHPGVYLDHTGPPTRHQREWAAILLHWPAALHRESALRAHGLTRDRGPSNPRSPDEPIRLLIGRSHRARQAAGVAVERVRDGERWVQWHRRPPRVRAEYAALKVAGDRDDPGAIAVLADVVQQGITTPARLLATLEQLPRLPHRAFLAAVLRDVAEGAQSVLEQRYLVQVERAHGLPRGQRQVRTVSDGRTAYRDVAYPEHRTLVETDGAFGHRDAADRWVDLARDLAAATAGQLTLRVGWAQVAEPCRLAGMIATVLRRRGWTDAPYPCRPDCPLNRAPEVSPGDICGAQSA